MFKPTNTRTGLDFVYNSIKYNKSHRTDEMWRAYFTRVGHYTGEHDAMGKTIIMTAEPENIKAILSTQFADYGKGPRFLGLTRGMLGESIFSTDGDLWHSSRQLIRPQFIKDRVSDLDCFETHTQNVFRAIENGQPHGADSVPVGGRGGDGKTVDISNMFFRFALDASTDFLMGKSVNSWW
ncbi:cytochrome P450 [Candidatus Bathyarchaeota archaeon]|nr:cytochrome P450 [Candidatus Bathyarchaeota archaeon]